MKKIIISTFLIICALSFQAQIVITNDDMVGPGAVVLLGLDTVPAGTIVPGTAGTNKVWDFSALQADWIDTVKFLLPAWTPFGQYFPDANFVSLELLLDSLYSFFYRDDDGLSRVGIVWNVSAIMDTTVIIRFNPYQTVAEYPVQYGNSRNDTGSYFYTIPVTTPPVDSMKYKYSIISFTEVDAWGTMTIPMGTYPALRVYQHQVKRDSTFIYVAGQWIFQAEMLDTVDRYTWWSNDDATGFYLADMEIPAGTKAVSSVLYLKESPLHISDHSGESILVRVFPNPASSYVIVETGKGAEGTIEIMDIRGTRIKTICCNTPGTYYVSLEGIPAGMYFFTLKDRDGTNVTTGKFIRR